MSAILVGRDVKEQVRAVIETAVADLKALNARHKGHASIAFCVVTEVSEDGEAGWLYVCNAKQPLDFLAEAAEQIEGVDGWEARSVQ